MADGFKFKAGERPSIEKAPGAALDYSLDWSAWLASGETITAATWEMPEALTLDDEDLDGAVATAWLSGGVAGVDYRVACAIVTSAGRADTRSFVVKCRDR